MQINAIWHIITDMICALTCQGIEVVTFLGLFHLCIFLNYVNQITKISLSKIIIRFRVPDFQNKRQISYHQGSYFFLLQQVVVLTLNLWWQVVEKVKQPNLQQKPATCFKCKRTFVTTRHESVKRRNKAFQGKKILWIFNLFLV